MGAAARYVHKLTDSPAVVSLGNTYAIGGRKDLIVPTTLSMDGITGRTSAIRMYGDAHTGGAKDMFAIVCYDQAGTRVWLDEISGPITKGPFLGGQWSVTLPVEHLVRLTADECPEGTISIFAHVDAGTAKWDDVHFLWEE